jgi:hypothetical protein
MVLTMLCTSLIHSQSVSGTVSDQRSASRASILVREQQMDTKQISMENLPSAMLVQMQF